MLHQDNNKILLLADTLPQYLSTDEDQCPQCAWYVMKTPSENAYASQISRQTDKGSTCPPLKYWLYAHLITM